MCRCKENHDLLPKEKQTRDDRLRFRAFYLRFSISSTSKYALPETLALVYLPRINGTFLDINDAKIRSESAGYVTLHRVRSAERHKGDAVFTSTDRVRVSDGVRFEVYLKEEKILKGVFRKGEMDLWRLDCKCTMERNLKGFGISEAEIGVAAEGSGVVNQKVKMAAKRRNRLERFGLEEIPEETESDLDGCDCEELVEMSSDGEDSSSSSAEESSEEDSTVEMEEVELDTEEVSWAVDLGIWVVCAGVGFLVSTATSPRSKKLF